MELRDLSGKLSVLRGHQLRLEGITHKFGEFVAVHDVDLDVPGGEIIALLGPSGCGKSTLLRIVSGFISQTHGRVLFDGEGVDHLPPNRRAVGIVFQNYALFPHMTVRENVAFGLQAQKWQRTHIAPRVVEMLRLVHMHEFADRRPRELSGGQQQRVALARCLAVDPKVLLLDEPFGALDKNLRLDMQIEVKRLQRQYGITMILVTHDQEEALSMADRVAVMNRGRIEQIASPTEIYDRPATLFVNQFVGTTNVIAGELIEADAGQCRVRIGSGELLAAASRPGLDASSKVVVSVRPEHVRLRDEPGPNCIGGSIKAVLPLGPDVLYEVELGAGATIKVSAPRRTIDESLRPLGQRVYAAPASMAACLVFRSP
jgi:putative spermidine/putrescine transport system ATP-binding protein